MIPKIIHYCWFGENPLDDKSVRCVESWKKYFPDYQIIQWNERNFDVTQIPFMKDAYDAKKWAFVSDVARLIILYEHGGFYFDTDVEVVRSYNDIVTEDTVGFMGMEEDCGLATGLGFAAEKQNPFIQKHIALYNQLRFSEYQDHLSDVACPLLTTRLMEQQGFVRENIRQTVCGFDIYPSSYFAPLSYLTGKLNRTGETHSIHWFNASWQNQYLRDKHARITRLRRIFGVKCGEQIYGCISCIRSEGMLVYIKTRIRKHLRGGSHV